jgi:hypothetical protein
MSDNNLVVMNEVKLFVFNSILDRYNEFLRDEKHQNFSAQLGTIHNGGSTSKT